MPDATPTSIDPPSRARRNNGWIAAQVAITAVVLWFVGRQLVKQWTAFRGAPTETLHPRWGMIGFSCVVVLLTYGVLIETWRRMVNAWGENMSFADAARMWCVSNLARYMPWSPLFVVGAMAELARRRRISPATAAGAALINTAVNIASGFVVALLAGFAAFDTLSGGHATIGLWIAGILLVGLLLLPNVLPMLLGVVERVTKRRLVVGVLPRSAIYLSLVGNVLAWVMYGVAFQWFVGGVLGQNIGSTVEYIAVWAGAYVTGYIAIALPAGVGVREAALIDGLTMLHLAGAGTAAVVAVAARLWLTVLEIVPALVYLARGARPQPQDPTPRDGSNS